LQVLQIVDIEPKPQCEKVLIHPISGARCHIIGSAHVSSASADEVRREILREKPDVVVLELDAERLEALLASASSARPALRAARRVTTTWDAFKLLFSGELPLVVGSLGYATVGALLDSRPGSEFVEAVRAAQEVGATIVVGDRHQRSTIERLFARVRRGSALYDAFVSEKQTEISDVGDGFGTESESTLNPPSDVAFKSGVESTKRLLDRAGCDSSDEVIKASMQILKAAVNGVPIRVDDLLRVRGCAVRVVEFVRMESFKGNPMFTPGMQPKNQKPTLMDWSVLHTVVHERDLVLAHALQRDSNAQRIVGVVGAGHVAGITKLWDDVQSTESRERFNEMLNSWPIDAKPPNYTSNIIAGILGATALTTILRNGSPRAIKLSGAFVGSAITLAGVGAYLGATSLVSVAKIAVAIEDASIKAAELGHTKDQALPKSTFHNMIVRDAAVPFKDL